MAFTTSQKTTDGREYVAVFGDPGSTTPTDRYVYKPDGTLESEWHANDCQPPKPINTNYPGIGKVPLR